MTDHMLLPVDDVVRAYKSGDLIGAFIDSPVLPSHLRKIASYNNDLLDDEVGHNNVNFESALKTNWKAGEWKGKCAYLWHYWVALDKSKALVGAQATGDCVSWGERCKQEIRRCVEMLQKGEREVYKSRQATCLIYAGRGHTGAGASPAGLANYATKCGILLEAPLTDSSGKQWDFTDYANYVREGMNRGRTGFPQAVLDITSKNRATGLARVRAIDELCDLMWNGYPASVGFSLDSSNKGNPVSRLSGSTAHQTCMVGFDDTPEARAICKQSMGYEDTIIFYDQSWGNWNSVNNRLAKWEPWGQGMYCHSSRDAQRHIKENECFTTTGSIIGFVGNPVDNLLI